MRALLHFAHLAGVVVWIGGMFFAHFCLRPIAATQLPPPQRLPLLTGVLGRFFAVVAIAISLILLSGFTAMLQTGLTASPLHWHLMATTGTLMVAIYGVIVGRHFPQLKAAVAAADWPAAAAATNRIRVLVATNLGLGTATLAVATLGSYLAG